MKLLSHREFKGRVVRRASEIELREGQHRVVEAPGLSAYAAYLVTMEEVEARLEAAGLVPKEDMAKLEAEANPQAPSVSTSTSPST